MIELTLFLSLLTRTSFSTFVTVNSVRIHRNKLKHCKQSLAKKKKELNRLFYLLQVMSKRSKTSLCWLTIYTYVFINVKLRYTVQLAVHTVYCAADCQQKTSGLNLAGTIFYSLLFLYIDWSVYLSYIYRNLFFISYNYRDKWQQSVRVSLPVEHLFQYKVFSTPTLSCLL